VEGVGDGDVLVDASDVANDTGVAVHSFSSGTCLILSAPF
jgi:hypothetical protein